MKKIVKIVIILAVIALLVILGMKAVNNKKAQEASKPVAKVYPIVVQTMIPKVSNVTLTLPYLAESVNETDVKISSRIAARIEQIKKSGDSVTKGEIVAKLDTTDLNAKIIAAKIALENLQKSHKRTKALYKVKGASIEQLQKEQSALAGLNANLKALKNQLDYATLTAPISGIISKSFAAAGDITMPGKPLVQISADKDFSLMVRVPQDVTPQAVIFDHKAYTLNNLRSTFNGLNEYKAFVDAKGLTAGDRVEVDIVIFKGKGTALPFDTILNRNGKSYVLLAKEGKAVAKEIQIRKKGQEGVVISDTLEGQKIIVAKQDILLKLLSGYAIREKK